MKKIRVMVVEDSLVIRTYLEHIIQRDPRLELVAAVSSAEEALNILPKTPVDILSLDIRLPGMNGLEATLRIMADCPLPIVVVAANVDEQELNISMNALRAGALAVIEKPAAVSGPEGERIAHAICDTLVSMSVIKVVRQRYGRSLKDATPAPTPPRPRPLESYKMLGLVASTGGPNALVAILSRLPAQFPIPIALVQHISPSFTQSFAKWLETLCPFRVELVAGGELPRAGTIYMPPADKHLIVEGNRLFLSDAEPVHMQKPAGSILLRSMAQALGPRAIGVLLTGMGEDGADGLLEMHKAGAYTIAEDESTCVVYGMPAAAVRMKAVSESLPLDSIAPRILDLLTQAGGNS